jgi:negative regulator of flagellin synthesis FlgM
MDKVTITETATKLKHALKSLSDGQVVDSKRVDQIKHAIDDGRYKIDTLKIANQLIRFEKEL